MALTIKPEPSAMDPTDLLTIEQLAQRLQVPKSWVFEQTRKRGKVRNGKDGLPCIYLSPKVVRFSWREVSQWITEKRTQ